MDSGSVSFRGSFSERSFRCRAELILGVWPASALLTRKDLVTTSRRSSSWSDSSGLFFARGSTRRIPMPVGSDWVQLFGEKHNRAMDPVPRNSTTAKLAGTTRRLLVPRSLPPSTCPWRQQTCSGSCRKESSVQSAPTAETSTPDC